jgi:hypothetical protein
MTSIVTGTEQRIYGFLSSNCNIWLKRFAVCLGSSSLSPSIYTGTVVYGDSVHYKQCGYKYNGYLSLLFIASGATLPYAVFEVRKCASGKNYIFIDSYGEVASSTLPISLWFNQGSETSPSWTLINSCTSGILTHPASETTFKFIENKGSSLTTELGCCKKCESCGCLNCDVLDRFYAINTTDSSLYINIHGIYGNGMLIPYNPLPGSPNSFSYFTTSVTSLNYGYNKYNNNSLLFGLTNIPINSYMQSMITWGKYKAYTVVVNGSGFPNNEIHGDTITGFLIVDPNGDIVFGESVNLETHYIDDDGIDNLIESYIVGRSFQSPNIGIEYTLNCNTIDITSYAMSQYNGIIIPTYKFIPMSNYGREIMQFKEGPDGNLYARAFDNASNEYFKTDGYTVWAIPSWEFPF